MMRTRTGFDSTFFCVVCAVWWPRICVRITPSGVQGGHRQPAVPRHGPVVDVTVSPGEWGRAVGDLDRVSEDRGAEVLLSVRGGQVHAAMCDVGGTLDAGGLRVGVDELPVIGNPYRPVLGYVDVSVGAVGHQYGLGLVHHHVDTAGGVAIRVGAQPVAGREVHHLLAVPDDHHAVAVDVGLDDLGAADHEPGADVFLAVGAVAESDAVELGGDADLGAGLPVVLGSVVRPGAAVVVR